MRKVSWAPAAWLRAWLLAWSLPWLLPLLLAEACLFSASIGKYFCGDSLYYFSHTPQDFSQLLPTFTHLDDLSTYRPLTFVIFRYLMWPIGGFTPWPYHLMALGAHLGVTVLVYFLLKRLANSPAGLLAAIAFFALHSVGFYISYDATFLPDFSVALLTAAALLAHAYQRRWWSLFFFTAALFCKESAIAIPVGLAVVGWLAARENPLKTMRAHGAVAAAYLVFQSLLHGGWLYPSSKSAYKFTMGPSNLWLKLKYVPWIFNLPADWFRQRWWMIPPLLLMIPVIVWTWRNWRDDAEYDARRTLLLCAAWALAALAPALPVAQVPMKHNLYVPVIALCVAIARGLGARSSGSTPARIPFAIVALLFLSTAFQVRNDLRTSWVGEGSDVTGASVAAVLQDYPVLPPGARFYILPAKIPGGISWYFDDQAWFRHLYNDPTLQVSYADLKRALPPDFATQTGLLIFAYDHGRLWDVTASYKQSALDPTRHALLPEFSRATVESSLTWKGDDLLNGRAAGIATARGEDELVVLPGTRVTFPLDHPLPEGAVLLAGVVPMGKQQESARGRLLWNGAQVAAVVVDQPIAGYYDLSAYAGQSGTLSVENTGGVGADWMAWTRMAITTRSSPYLAQVANLSETEGDPLLAGIESAPAESSIAWKESEKPDGHLAEVQLVEHNGSRRTSLVLLPQTTVRVAVSALPRDALLLVGAGSVGKQRGAAQGRLLWNGAEIARVLIDPGSQTKTWWDGMIDLGAYAGQSGTLTLENTGSRDSDWIAWNRLRIVPRAASPPAVEAGARSLSEMGNPLLADFAQSSISTSVPWMAADLAGGRPANLKLLGRDGVAHESMLELPSTDVQFPVAIPAHAHLSLALTTLGSSEAAVEFNGTRVFHTYLDSIADGDRWRDGDIDLSAYAGQSGTLAFRNLADRTRGTIAWSAIHLGPAQARPREISLFDLLAESPADFDRTEVYPDYEHFDTPGGKPVFVWWDNKALPHRLSLVTIAGTRAHYTFDALPEHASLSFAISHGTGVGDGAEARLYWNGELIYRRYLTPEMRDWSDVIVPLRGRSGTIDLQITSGPKHSAVGDWVAWSGLRILGN